MIGMRSIRSFQIQMLIIQVHVEEFNRPIVVVVEKETTEEETIEEDEEAVDAK